MMAKYQVYVASISSPGTNICDPGTTYNVVLGLIYDPGTTYN